MDYSCSTAVWEGVIICASVYINFESRKKIRESHVYFDKSMVL